MMLMPYSKSFRFFPSHRDHNSVAHLGPPGPAWWWPPFWWHLVLFFPKVLLAPVPFVSLLICDIRSFSCFRVSVLMISSAWNIHPFPVIMATFLVSSTSRLWYNLHKKAIQNSTCSYLRELLCAFSLFDLPPQYISLQNIFLFIHQSKALFCSLPYP